MAVSGIANTTINGAKGFFMAGLNWFGCEAPSAPSEEVAFSGVSIGVLNHAGKSGRFAFQIGAWNNIREVNEGDAVIQIGLINRSGNRTIPLINIVGLKKLLRLREHRTANDSAKHSAG